MSRCRSTINLPNADGRVRDETTITKQCIRSAGHLGRAEHTAMLYANVRVEWWYRRGDRTWRRSA